MCPRRKGKASTPQQFAAHITAEVAANRISATHAAQLLRVFLTLKKTKNLGLI